MSRTSETSRTILFADDNETFRIPIALVLNRLGYEVITASDGNDALQKAREFKGVIHLLLSDIEMPYMTGIELAIHLSRERPDTTIVLISGRNPELPVPNNGWRFLPKQLMADRLRDRIRDLFKEVEEAPVEATRILHGITSLRCGSDSDRQVQDSSPPTHRAWRRLSPPGRRRSRPVV